MARYKLTLAYDGTGFSGSQRQAKRRTVQAELESALRRLGWNGSTVLLAGRTDAGVHALGQVAAMDLDWKHGSDRLRDALNAQLPRDVAIRSVEVADPRFHPRFDALSRRYRYQIYFQPVRDPLRERMSWRLWPPVPVKLLSRVANAFVGRHDFAGYGSPPRKHAATVRTVTTAKWAGSGDELHFQVTADGFLYRMVRRMVFVQLCVARGTCSENAIEMALAKPGGNNRLPGGLAPASGLTLMGVDYSERLEKTLGAGGASKMEKASAKDLLSKVR